MRNGTFTQWKFNSSAMESGLVYSFKRAVCRGQRGVQLRYAAVNVWEDGRIERITNYSDIDEGRAVAERLAEERG